MESFKLIASELSESKKELQKLSVKTIRQHLLEAALKADGAALRCDNCYVRAIKRQTRQFPSKEKIINALQTMEEPSVDEFITKLNVLCLKESTALSITKNAKTHTIMADDATNAFAKELAFMNEKRKVAREKIKVLRQNYSAKESELISAMKSDKLTALEKNGISVFFKPKFTRKRVNPLKARDILQPIFEDPGTSDLYELAEILYNALNPREATERLVVKF